MIEPNRLRNFDCGVLPFIPDWWKTQTRRQTRRNHDDAAVAQLPGKADCGIGKHSSNRQRQVTSGVEKIWMIAAKAQQALDQKHFDASVRPGFEKLRRLYLSQCLEHSLANFVVDRPTVVGVDQRQIPNLISLVDVRHARRSKFQ